MQLKINFPGFDDLSSFGRSEAFCLNSPHFISPQLAIAGNSCRLTSELLMKLIYEPKINIIHRFTFFSLSASRHPIEFRLHLFHNLFSRK